MKPFYGSPDTRAGQGYQWPSLAFGRLVRCVSFRGSVHLFVHLPIHLWNPWKCLFSTSDLNKMERGISGDPFLHAPRHTDTHAELKSTMFFFAGNKPLLKGRNRFTISSTFKLCFSFQCIIICTWTVFLLCPQLSLEKEKQVNTFHFHLMFPFLFEPIYSFNA